MKIPLLNLSGFHRIAMGHSHRNVAEWVSYNDNINALDTWNRNAAHWAARNGRLEVLIDLTCYEIDLNQEDLNGQTPLHLAAKKGHIVVIAFLMSHKVPHKPDRKGRYPLHVASLEAFKKIIELGANFNVVDGKGRTPFKALKAANHHKMPDLELHGFMKNNVKSYTNNL